MMPTGHITLQNKYGIYKGDNDNNNDNRPNNTEKGIEANTNSCIFQIVIKAYNILNVD